MAPSFRDSLSTKLRRFKPLRTVYRALLGAEGRERRRKLAAFYSQFIQKDDLVFDIGANIGVYSEALQSIGARVVAIEPNPDCAEQISWTTSKEKVTVVQAAVGDTAGTCNLFVNKMSILSTVSDDWVKGEKDAKPHEAEMWHKTIAVPMVTIDGLIASYGMPRFIKLDVEGFELKALSGMSHQPEYLSFEFHAVTIDKDEACLDKLSPLTRFDFVINEPFRFEIGDWVSREQVWDTIKAAHISTFGDVFAHLDQPALRQAKH